MTNKNKKKFEINKLFRSNKFLVLFSFITACIMWLFFAQNTQQDFTATINDIPISIELSQDAKDDGLEIISGADTLASVRISGNRLLVGNATKNDIQVVAQQSTTIITAPNTYKLDLVAKHNGVKSDYQVLSVNPTSVTVVVDSIGQKELPIIDNIKYTYTVNEKYYANKPILSKEKILIKGPQSEINKVHSASIEGDFKGDLKEITVSNYQVKLYDKNNKEIKSKNIVTDIENNEVSVTIAILQKKELPIEVGFINVAEGINASHLVSVKPKTIMVAGPTKEIDKITSVKLNPIDFTTITPSTDFVDLAIELPVNCVNINNVHKARVDFDLKEYASKRVEVKKFRVINTESGYKAKVTTSSVFIDVMGPKEEIKELSSSNVKAVIDLKVNKSVGTLEIPFTVEINNINNCWSYNTDNNTVAISITAVE